jgi:hypothetical protein
LTQNSKDNISIQFTIRKKSLGRPKKRWALNSTTRLQQKIWSYTSTDDDGGDVIND